ncbi:hypothetical protein METBISCDRAFT_27062 [Metschnikowia bicuspidata]|uniref:Mannosyl-oligosaccharide glucosidase n=1 Tax=Metschnikowia bicuspidata TaxID=27322 RepID=A0A4P9ZFZ0_9ASCO|nr:hypothetical protein METBISCDRAFT_27062 [Metschnikowia bicuspidata]
MGPSEEFLNMLTAEERRLYENRQRIKYHQRWGSYLSERQWATVREDYSASGSAWDDFSFDDSRYRTYRWGEDGLAGTCDTHQLVCISMALWNGKDDILKEKLFGVTNSQGNHGEDVKELYYYLDNTPTHSYMKFLYKYPHAKFPYEKLVSENRKRTRLELEYEITDTGAFDEGRYFDVVHEVAKSDDDPEELLFRITAYNRGPEAAPLHIMPHIVFRNTWSWGLETAQKPHMKALDASTVEVDHPKFGPRKMVFAPAPGIADGSADVEPVLLFTENETNKKHLYQQENEADYVKNSFHDYIVDGVESAVNPAKEGTKACAWFSFDQDGGVPTGDYVTIRYRFSKSDGEIDELEFDNVFARRQDEADAFYWKVSPLPLSNELRQVQRQAFAGLLWTKQFYYFVHSYWLGGDPNHPPPPENRANGRNKDWKHLFIDDVLSLPDKWEYPFFAAWDTAFHCIPFAMIDPEFAKKQLVLLTREWYMHPNGQLPAYEWNFSDVNPPVHAWSCYRVFKIERKMYGREDLDFLEGCFQKLLLNFTWWVNRKDTEGYNLFEGGFLGLDNIGAFNRSEPLPTGGRLQQSDSTGWMAFYCLQMLNIALELAKTRPVYQNIASKFFEHFLLIADAMSYHGAKDSDSEPTDQSLWDDHDKFYYDAIHFGLHTTSLPIRSLVGLIPLYASLTLEPELLNKFPSFKKRLDWFIENRRGVAERNIALMSNRGVGERLLLSLVNKDRLVSILERMLDEDEFLSDYGIRSLSKYHDGHPFQLDVNGQHYDVKYLPGESDSGMFGGNSNWRGPIWFPVNFLLVESLQRFYLYYGSDLRVECPKGSGQYLNLAQCAQEIQHRLIHLFIPDVDGKRACKGDNDLVNHDPYFKDYVPFYEYFDGDTGRGLGALHQCGWTAVVAKWIHDNGLTCRAPKTPRTPLPECKQSINSFTPDDDDPKSSDDITLYAPRAGPFPGTVMRRRSGKSLLNLTIHALDDDENTSGIASVTSGQNVTAKLSELDLCPQMSRSSNDLKPFDENLVDQIRAAFDKYQQRTDEDEADEFETRH